MSGHDDRPPASLPLKKAGSVGQELIYPHFLKVIKLAHLIFSNVLQMQNKLTWYLGTAVL